MMSGRILDVTPVLQLSDDLTVYRPFLALMDPRTFGYAMPPARRKRMSEVRGGYTNGSSLSSSICDEMVSTVMLPSRKGDFFNNLPKCRSTIHSS